MTPSNAKIIRLFIDQGRRPGTTVLLIAVMMISTMLVVTMVSAELVRNGLRMGTTQAHSTQAYFAAEAGVERVLYAIFKEAYDVPTECNQVGWCLRFDANCDIVGCNNACTNSNNWCLLANGTSYKVEYIQAPVTPNPLQLKITGYYEDQVTQRVVQLDL